MPCSDVYIIPQGIGHMLSEPFSDPEKDRAQAILAGRSPEWAEVDHRQRLPGVVVRHV